MTVLTWAEDRLLPDSVRVGLTGPGAPFEQRPEVVLGSEMPVFAQRARSARQMLQAATARLGDQPFLVFPERTFTYRSIHRSISAVAASLADRFGVGPGEPRRHRQPEHRGPCHHRLGDRLARRGRGRAQRLVDRGGNGPRGELTQPRVVFGDRRRLERIPAGVVDPAVPLVCFEDDFARLEAAGEGRPLPPDTVREDDPLTILFTSGTTGRPKGAVLSHRCHVNMMMQAALQGQVGAFAGEGGAGAAPPISIGVSPMFHVSGFSSAVIGGALTGLTIVYPPPGRWDPDVHLELTQRHRVSSWPIVPTQLWRLLEHPRLGDFDLSSLQRVGGGGSTFQPELWRQVGQRLPQVARMATGYGMTETTGAGTHHDGQAAIDHPDAVGAPVPGYAICVRDPEGGLLPEGQTGEIHLRGASNFIGYWDDPDATNRALDHDRWYRTGELGHMEGGLLYLDGRGSDLIIRGGENIYPIEIENRLIEHPGIAEAAVIGVADRVLGEKVKAVIVAHPGAILDTADDPGLGRPELGGLQGSEPGGSGAGVAPQCIREGAQEDAAVECR